MDSKKYKILVKGQDVTKDVIDISLAGGKIAIKYKNGRSYSYNTFNVKVEKSALNDEQSNNCFEYLKQIAGAVGLRDDIGRNILLKNYKRIGFLPKEAVLADFLSGGIGANNNTISAAPIFPFGFNLSQRKAVERALSSRLSIIEGPPGTGKTQTILNIIANIVMAGKTVAVVSANNSATANVLEKLEKYNVGFIVALLGNTTNIAAFSAANHDLPDMSGWSKNSRWLLSVKHHLRAMNTELSEMLAIQNQVAKNRQELDALKTEYGHFSIKYSNADTSAIAHLSSDMVIRFWLDCEERFGRAKRLSFFVRIVNLFRYRITQWQFYRQSLEQIIITCQMHWYAQRQKELERVIERAEKRLDAYSFDAKCQEYSNLSMLVMKHELAKKYTNSDRKKSHVGKDFLKEYPVILSTTYSLTNCLFDGLYDYVIIDEASQVDIATGALALGCARNAIIVGDLKQLPNVVDEESAIKTDEIFKEYGVAENYRYKNHSILSAVSVLFPDAPATMLREHYRCHPKIIEFCNQRFYGGKLIPLTRPKSDRVPLVVYKTVAGNHARSRMNQRQIDVIMDEVIPQQKLNVNDGTVGIVSPYRNQVTALRSVFRDTSVQVDTVDKFQGREKSVIILSMVDNQISEFADQPNRLNVAVSRAIDQLIVVTNGNEETRDTNIQSLIDYINYNNLTIMNSRLDSVFDCLYDCYAEARRQMIKTKVSEYDSENLMYELIQDVLTIDRFKHLGLVMHMPLKNIFKDLSCLPRAEYDYANNILTHCDFLLYDRVARRSIMGIEVDGTTYHKAGSRQSERDKMKDSIFAMFQLPLARFCTNGSQEKQKLIRILDGLTV